MSYSEATFSLTIGCPILCKYCPQNVVTSRYKQLFPNDSTIIQYEAFQKIVDKLQVDQICFSGFAEPCLHPDWLKMVEYARASNPRYSKMRLYTTLVNLNIKDIPRLEKIKGLKLIVHLADDGLYMGLKITEQYCKVLTAILQSTLRTHFLFLSTRKVPERISEIFLQNPPKYPLDPQNPIEIGSPLSNRAANLKNFIPLAGDMPAIFSDKQEQKLYCQFNLEKYFILPNGAVLPCSNDWSLQFVLGNLLTDSFESITSENNPIKQKIRKNLKQGTFSSCTACSRAIPY